MLDLFGPNAICYYQTERKCELVKTRTQKSFGWNRLYTKLIWQLVQIIMNPICKNFNKLLETWIVSKDWKSADISPIFERKLLEIIHIITYMLA